MVTTLMNAKPQYVSPAVLLLSSHVLLVILQSFLPSPTRTTAHRSTMPTHQSQSSGCAVANSYVHTVRQSVREQRRAPAAYHVPSASIYNDCSPVRFNIDSCQVVLSHQFDTSTDFGNLLRANTPVSRMMTTYTRRGPGGSYLKSVLAERINSLIEHRELNLEINPVKVRNLCYDIAG